MKRKFARSPFRTSRRLQHKSRHFLAKLLAAARRPLPPRPAGHLLEFDKEPSFGANLAREIGGTRVPPPTSTSDNLLLADAYSRGFTVSLGSIYDFGDFWLDGDKFTLFLAPNLQLGEIVLSTDPETFLPTPDTIEFNVRPEFLGARIDYTTRELYYRVTYDATGNGTEGPRVPISADARPPAPGELFLAKPEVDDELVKNGIGGDSFKNEGGREFIEARVPGYVGIKEGDWIRPYINASVTPNEADYTVVTSDDTTTLTIRYYREFIETFDDGLLAFQYDVFPREELASSLSHPNPLMAALKDAIPALAALLVPAHDAPTGDGLVVEEEARNDLVVVIASRDEITDEDRIRILWGNDASQPVAIDDPGDIRIVVPYPPIQDQWLSGNASGGDLAVPVNVRYQVVGKTGNVRGTSPDHEVLVNLHVAAGIVDPDPETPENELLAAASSRSASGAPNRIPLVDDGEDATVLVPKLTVDDIPVIPFKLDDEIIVSFDGNEIGTHKITAADLNPANLNNPIEIPLPWAAIEAAGAGAIALSYVIRTTLGSGQSNDAQAPAQEVIVESADELPGGGVLDNAILPERGADSRIVHGHLLNGVAVALPIWKNFGEDDVVDVYIPMYRGNHAPTEAPVPGYGAEDGDADQSNRFRLPTPLVRLPPEVGDQPEPPGGGDGAIPNRPPVTVEHVLFRLPYDRIPDGETIAFFHSHIRWTVTNGLGMGKSPTDPINARVYTVFDTRGTPGATAALNTLDTADAVDGAQPEHRCSGYEEGLLERIERLLRGRRR